MLHDLPPGGAPDAGVRANVFERRVQRTDPVRLAGDKGVDRDRHDAGDRFAFPIERVVVAELGTASAIDPVTFNGMTCRRISR